jgi:peptidyl-prolyl cis-trans isomerase A (cyclophilin A)
MQVHYSKPFGAVMLVLGTLLFAAPIDAGEYPLVVIHTNFGLIEVELYPSKTPQTVENFLRYVDDGFYSNTVFHRVVKNFVIQGGGYDIKGEKKETSAPIPLEAKRGLLNKRGTVVAARAHKPDSATCQFYINLKDNDFLDKHGGGYAVFGQVTKGMQVVDSIAKTRVARKNNLANWPVAPVVIEAILRIRSAAPALPERPPLTPEKPISKPE